MSITSRIKQLFRKPKEQDPAPAYDLWAAAYDNQPGNLMLDLDEQVFGDLFNASHSTGRTIADIGCGTGRHWKKIYDCRPARLIGYDVSPGMLARLKEKFPAAETYLLAGNRLTELPDRCCDLVVSTLAIAHIPDPTAALREWNRVLKPGGGIIITDYHPEALAKGGRRTFKHEGKTMAVKNYVHPVDSLRDTTRQLGWTEIRFTERVIDDSVKGYYERQNALRLFDEYKDIPIIYGIYLKKADDPA
jgi:ubiquinone/menaquinone biosynthesis C-methylase UbiE